MIGLTDGLGAMRRTEASLAAQDTRAAQRTESLCLMVIFGIAVAEIVLLYATFAG